MRGFIRVLIGLSALGFVLAVISAFVGPMFGGISAEGFSQGSTNMALIAIALSVLPK